MIGPLFLFMVVIVVMTVCCTIVAVKTKDTSVLLIPVLIFVLYVLCDNGYAWKKIHSDMKYDQTGSSE